MNMSRAGGFMALIAFAALLVIPTIADARFGRGGFGSRGAKTWSKPPVTRTAPKAVRPIQRSNTPRQSFNRAGTTTRPGLFGGMSRGGFMAGLLGAGLLGLLFGYGLSGGLGGLASILGLILQAGLIVMLVMLVMSWFRRRQTATASPGHMRPGPGGAAHPAQRSADDWRSNREAPNTGMSAKAGLQSYAPGGSGFGDRSAEVATKPLTVAEADFDAFERLLTDVQSAYAREDMGALRRLATEEMCSYFTEDIEENKQKGQAIRIDDVKLLQGDLSEAWSEPDAEYATVAMRFALADAIVDRKTERVVEGSLTEPQELVEIWTFVRRPSGRASDWQLTAVQPTDDED